MNDNEQIAAELEAIAAEVENGQPAGAEPQPAATMQERLQQMPGRDLAHQTLNITFSLLAKIRGPHWEVDPAVMEEAANEYGAMLDQYGGNINLPPWAGTAVITGLLLYRPVLGEVAIKKQREAEEAAKAEAEQNQSENKGVDDAD